MWSHFKGSPEIHSFSDQISKSGFSKIEHNYDNEKIIKTPECERIENSRYFELSNAKIGLETIEISYIMANTTVGYGEVRTLGLAKSA